MALQLAPARQPIFSTDAEAEPEPSQGHGIFPLHPFKCCPSPVLALLPGTIQSIQDWTHLTLVMGVFASSALVLQTAVSIWTMNWDAFTITKSVIVVMFILPCAIYCIRIIGQYDDRLQTKQQQAKEAKANLTRCYNDLLADMDGLLSKSTESSAGLAERSFESKRRDFQRFLERAKQRYSTLYKGTKNDTDQLLKQFRRFCANWFNVFAECSIDPVSCPKRVITMEELNRCATVAEVADLCLERLRVTEVRFISQQRDQDQQLLQKSRTEIRRFSAQTSETLDHGRLTLPAPVTTPQRPTTGKRVSWISIGSGHGLGVNRSPGPDGFPREIRFGCGRLVVLSREHLMLMAGAIAGSFIVVLTLANLGVPSSDNSKKHENPVHFFEILEVLVTEVCLLVTLVRFEELDVIQQLEREVRELAKQNEQVQQQRERMGEFWGNVQQLTELWLYRTVPRLDLFKEIHSQLEDAPAEDLLVNIAQANHELEELDKNLGALEWWRGDGAIAVEDKKRFGKAINQLCQEPQFEELLVKLEDVIANGTTHLQALPAPAAHGHGHGHGHGHSVHSGPNFTGQSRSD